MRLPEGRAVLYFAFEESESQVMRNMLSSVSILRQWVKKDF